MVIVDNSALSSLEFVNQSNILEFFFNEVIVPNAVYVEFKKKWISLFNIKHTIINVDPLEFSEFLSQTNLENFGYGDKEVIFFALKLQAMVITDDMKIKNYCNEKNIPVIGTLRLLKNGYLNNYFKSKSKYLEIIELISQDLYLSKDLIRWVKDV